MDWRRRGAPSRPKCLRNPEFVEHVLIVDVVIGHRHSDPGPDVLATDSRRVAGAEERLVKLTEAAVNRQVAGSIEISLLRPHDDEGPEAAVGYCWDEGMDTRKAVEPDCPEERNARNSRSVLEKPPPSTGDLCRRGLERRPRLPKAWAHQTDSMLLRSGGESGIEQSGVAKQLAPSLHRV